MKKIILIILFFLFYLKAENVTNTNRINGLSKNIDDSFLKISGRFIGRLNNEFNPTVSESSRTWRLDEFPENILYLNFNFLFLEKLSGLVTLAAKTTKEVKREKYSSKWKNFTIFLSQAHILLETLYGNLIAYYNEDIMSFYTPLKILTGLKLFSEYRHIYKEIGEPLYQRTLSYEKFVDIKLYNEFTDIYNPFDNSIIRSVNLSERFGKGTHGIIFQTKYSIFKNSFILADDNTTREDNGTLQTHSLKEGYVVYLDANQNSILDINENDIMHHNFWADRFEIKLSDIEFGITYIAEQLYRWEFEAKMADPWDKNFSSFSNNDQILLKYDLITRSSLDTNVYIRAAERYARQDFFCFDVSYQKLKNIKISAEFGLNKIKHQYVSKPKNSHITKYDARYQYYTINNDIDIEIPWNKGDHIGNAFGVNIEYKILKGLLQAGFKIENKVFNSQIFDNPNETDPAYIGYKEISRPLNKETIFLEVNYNFYGFEPDIKFVNIAYENEYPLGSLKGLVYTNSFKKRNEIYLFYSEIKKLFFKNFLPVIKFQFINFGKVSAVHSQLSTPFVLKDNPSEISECFVDVDDSKITTSLLTGIELFYWIHKNIRTKFSAYFEHISNKVEDLEDFKKLYFEIIVDF